MWRNRLLAVCFAILFALIVYPISAFALTAEEEANALIQDFIAQIGNIYTFIMSIVRPIATVLLAGYGIGCLFGTQKDLEKNLGKIKFLALAVAVLWFLPTIIYGAKTLFSPLFPTGGLPAPD